MRQHDNSETTKKIIKAFEDAKLLRLITFDHKKVHINKVIEFYLNAVILGDGTIKSTINEVEVIISAEDIQEAFDMDEASNLDVSSHTFNHKQFWDEIRKYPNAQIVKFSGKKKELLQEVWERNIDIIYKCIESKVAGMDDITPEKINVLSAIMSGYKCDWARHVFNCLRGFILKAMKPGSRTIHSNVGFGFLIATLLKKKGIILSEGTDFHPSVYLFRHAVKGKGKRNKKKKDEPSAKSTSFNMPLTPLKKEESRRSCSGCSCELLKMRCGLATFEQENEDNSSGSS